MSKTLVKTIKVHAFNLDSRKLLHFFLLNINSL